MKTAFIGLLLIFCAGIAFPCSMYKLTADGKTVVGNNEDSWGRDSRIWFEPATENTFGVVNVGYARKHPNPDGAMNEHGLVFDAFTMYRKDNVPEKDPNKKDFGYGHIRTIMQQCKTVDDVYAYLDTLNLHVLNGSPIFHGGMLLFADRAGKYLVAEANKLTLGNDAKFVLANFSVADTKDLSTVTMPRYCKGVSYLENKELDVSLDFCRDLSDTMSVNRAKVGNGTLYTSIYDLEEGLINLYFYHDYSKHIQFNLKDELAKGAHSFYFEDLFPDNQKYQEFLEYKTPQNSKLIFSFLIACGFLFFFSSWFYLISFFRSSNNSYKILKLGVSVLSIALCVYSYVLLRNQGIFYFPSPYVDGRPFIAMTSYLPFVLLLSIFPLLVATVKVFRFQKWRGSSKWLLLTNNLAYFILIGLFLYWDLYDVFS